jgi:hypothetical protein
MERMMATAASAKQNRIVMLVMGAYLIFGLAMAVTQAAGEFPPWGYAVFNIVLDAVMTLLLAVLVLAERGAPLGGLKAVAMTVGGLGVLAGVAQVAIRFTSDHAWWTGSYLPPVFN